MSIKTVNTIADLAFDDRNVNKGTERGSAMIERSLRSCGAGRSILIDKNGKIIAGNKTVENAGLIGIEDLQVVQSDGTKIVAVQRIDLDLDSADDKRAQELALFDNRTAQVNLEWDEDVLASLQDEGFDFSGLFNDDELYQMIESAQNAATEAPTPPDEFAAVDENLATAFQCPKCGYEWSGQPKERSDQRQG